MPIPEDTIRDGLLDELVSRVQADVPDDEAIRDALSRVSGRIAGPLAEAGGTGGTGGRRSLLRRLAARPAFLTAACLVLVASVVTMVAWLTGGNESEGIAFAEVIQPFREGRTVRFSASVTSEGIPEQVMECISADPGLMRCSASDENPLTGGMVLIVDASQGKMLTLMPGMQMAMMMSIPPQSPYYFIEELRKTMADEAEPAGEREIDGRWAVGFRVTGDYMEQVIWADRETSLPTRIEVTIEVEGLTGTPVRQTQVMSDFVFDEPVDESLFRLDVPEGYQLQELELDMSLPGERDLIDFLRLYAESMAGRFPLEITLNAAAEMMMTHVDELEGDARKRVGEMMKPSMKGAKAFLFVQKLKPENDWRYAAGGVRLGEAETAICRWRPDGSESYRVIYADLTVREVPADQLPDMSGGALPEQALLDFLRAYAEQMNGRFPPALDDEAGSDAYIASRSNEMDDSPGESGSSTVSAICDGGIRFVHRLGAENDWFYAGRGVMLGTPDTPVFRWRPDGSDVYRVVHADLTLREVSSDELPEMKVFEGPVTANEVLEVYNSRRKEACQSYVAVVHHKTAERTSVSAYHKDGSQLRSDERRIFKAGPAGDDFDSLYQWVRKKEARVKTIDLVDAEHHYTIYCVPTRGWDVRRSRSYWRDDVSMDIRDDVAGLGWPAIYVIDDRVNDDEYANERGLICLEYLSRGHISERGKVFLPSRTRYYLDPERDYICRRIEEVRRRDVPWRKDKSWLDDVDPAAIGPEGTELTEVTEVMHTEDGRWYPARVEKRTIRRRADGTSSIEDEEIKTVQIDVDRAMPEGLFDVAPFHTQPADDR